MKNHNIKCHVCGTVHELNIPSLFAKLRTDKLTKSEREEIGKRLAEARRKKHLANLNPRT